MCDEDSILNLSPPTAAEQGNIRPFRDAEEIGLRMKRPPVRNGHDLEHGTPWESCSVAMLTNAWPER